ncbi:MAG: NADPH-dependent F420 reductase [Candidatus Promineifilaceae bacterium]
MKISILGAGSVGGNLGRVWTQRGHQVVFGVRDPNSDKAQRALAAAGAAARAVPLREAAGWGEVVVIAVPWTAVPDTLAAAGELRGKIVIDTTNAIRWDNGPVKAVNPSAAEKIAGWLPGSHVVKAFNTIGAEHMLQPDFDGEPADMFICGDDAIARATVAALARDIGFVPRDAGPLRNAALLESLGTLWIHMATAGGLGRNVAFKLLQKGT